MDRMMKRNISWLLVVAMLLVLLPFSVTSSYAENDDQITATETVPILNKTVVGTVAFQSFNFLGNNKEGQDGTDYHSTFYYTDDYFSPSAVNPNVENIADVEQSWKMLEDISMATCSMDFAVASYTSAEGDVVKPSTQTWNNSDYSNKDKNVISFLKQCGFAESDIHPNDEMTKHPSNDSIGYTLAKKKITVWDDEAQDNKTYTLIAVGVRGAGYGAEWASNVTIGDPSTGLIPENDRHYGFDHSADIICDDIDKFLKEENITGEVKYWVAGFSRAGAVANLVAGKLTDNGNLYHTQQKDVYGYTWECPQGASTEDEPLKYKNIHNIINAMDAVPKVSPSAFNHCRLGVDYVMPYHGNTTSAENEAYYNQMYKVLETIAVGDGVSTDVLVGPNGYCNPNNYPYNKKITIYKMSVIQLLADLTDNTLMTNFGSVEARSNLDDPSKLLGKNDGGWYMDDFIDNLVDVFLTSKAWIGGAGDGRSPLENRATFIKDYQPDFRTLFGYFLDFSGPAFLELLDKLMDAVLDEFSGFSLLSKAGPALALYGFYNDPLGTYSTSWNPFASNYTFVSSWRGKPKKDVLVSETKDVAVKIANQMTNGFPSQDYQGITRAQMNNALEHLVPLVINLYAYELGKYESQYLGTTLKYLWTILCTHEQETVLSWIMSLDPNHMNRAYRTVTLPKDVNVNMLQFRTDRYEDEVLSESGSAPTVATFENGTFTTLDQRIVHEVSGNDLTIRYPASLNIRFDITSDTDIDDVSFKVYDYKTASAYENVSAGESQYANTNPGSGYNQARNDTNWLTINNMSDSETPVPLSKKDTLQILVKANDAYDDLGDNTTYSINKNVYANLIVEGQVWSDGSYTPYLMDSEGNITTIEEAQEQVHIQAEQGSETFESCYGNPVTMTLPTIGTLAPDWSYYKTDASDNNAQKLTEEDGNNIPESLQRNTTGSFVVGSSENAANLTAEDAVYHVFYTGDKTDLNPKTVTRVLDFNTKMKLADEVISFEQKRADNGKFIEENNKLLYQLGTRLFGDFTSRLTSKMEDGPDQADIAGKHAGETKLSMKTVNVLPASSVYFDDDLMETETVIGDGSGYMTELTGEESSKLAKNISSKDETITLEFTFFGTGVDIYCTTDAENGYMQASIFKNGVIQKDENGKNRSVIIKNASDIPRYNIPTIRFQNMERDEYVLRLNVLRNSNYKLDGIRVYGAVSDQDQYGDSMEKDAVYVNLRDVLINDNDNYIAAEDPGWDTAATDDSVDAEKISGILFLDNTRQIKNGIFTDAFAAYKANGPKNEIYLAGAKDGAAQGLVFRLKAPGAAQKYWLGLSAPEDGGQPNGKVTVNGQEITVHSYVDMYYPIQPDSSGTIRIENTGSSLISVTNLKMGRYTGPSLSDLRTALFAPMTRSTLKMISNEPVLEEPVEEPDPETPDVTTVPEPTPDPDIESEDETIVEPEPDPFVTPTPQPTSGSTASFTERIRAVVQKVQTLLRNLFRF